MKPLYLELSAIGPYRDVVKLPLEALYEGCLVLLCGDTGAGKTFLFDAMCYALYGSASGDVRKESGLRSEYAVDEESYVRLDFEHRGKFYRIERKPSYLRPKKRGDGVTKEDSYAAIYEMLHRSTGAANLLAKNVSEVTAKVEELLGVNEHEFKQICMIAQGEFHKILFANSNERKETYRKIFGGEWIRNFIDRIKEAESKRKDTLLRERDLIIRSIEELLRPGDDTTELMDIRKKNEVFPDFTPYYLRIEEEINEEKKELQHLSDGLKAYEDKKKKAEENLKEAEAREKLYQEKSRIEEKRAALKKREGGILCLNEELTNAKRAESLRTLYEMYQRSSDERTEKECEIKNLRQKIAVLEEKKKYVEDKAVQLEAQRSKEESAKIELLQIEERRKSHEERAKLLQELTDVNKSLQSAEEDLRKEEDLRESNEAERKKAEEELKKYEELPTISEAEKNLEILRGKHEKAKGRLGLLEKSEEVRSDILKGENGLNHSEKEAQIKDAELREIKEKERNYYLHEAKLKLKEGEPCPVCGSLHHQPVEKEEMAEGGKSFTSEEIRSMEKELSDLQAKMEGERVKLNLRRQNLEELLRQAEREFQCPREELSRSKAEGELIRIWEDIQREEKELILLKEKKKKETALRTMLQNLKKEEEKREPLLKEMKKKTDNLRLNCAQKKGVLSGYKTEFTKEEDERSERALKEYLGRMESARETIRQEREKNLQENSEASGSLKSLESAYEKLQRQQKEEEQKLTSGMKEKQFASMDVLCAAFRSEQQRNSMEESIRSFHKEQDVLEEEFRKNEILIKDKPLLPTGEYRDTVRKIEEEHKKAEREYGGRRNDLKSKQNRFESLKKDVAKNLREKDEYTRLKKLYQVASGTDGGDKIDFEAYILGYYFDRILYGANIRLRKLSYDRYALLRDESKKGNSQVGLGLKIMDNHTGKPRDVSSLSGGEKFLASLCMAFGLSDYIQSLHGGLELRALFIDEGFGTLDQDYLSRVIEILGEISDSGRLVAMISHVQELRERIAQKIIVKKSAKGSTLEIQGVDLDT